MRNVQKIVVLLLTGFFAASAQAGVGKIVAMANAVEADHIRLVLDDNKMTGSVLVSGCEQCPMDLVLRASSRLYYKNKTLSRKRVKKVSGKSGTVVYNKDTRKVIKIRW